MKRLKQILCLVCVVVLIGLYVLALVLALTDHSEAHNALMASIYATFAVPIFLYAFFLVLRYMEKKKEEE